MLISSLKSLEGKSFVAIIAALIPVVWAIAVNFGFLDQGQQEVISTIAKTLPMDKIAADSRSATEIVSLMKTIAATSNPESSVVITKSVSSIAFITVFLVVIRFLFKDFTTARTTLKLKAMELEAKNKLIK